MAEKTGVFGTRKGLPYWPTKKTRENGCESVLSGQQASEFNAAMERSRRSNKEFERLRKRLDATEKKLNDLQNQITMIQAQLAGFV